MKKLLETCPDMLDIEDDFGIILVWILIFNFSLVDEFISLSLFHLIVDLASTRQISLQSIAMELKALDNAFAILSRIKGLYIIYHYLFKIRNKMLKYFVIRFRRFRR